MFGDDNQMQVVVSSQDLAALNVLDHAAVAAGLARLDQAIQAVPGEDRESLPAGDKVELQRILREILDELKKPRESQSPGFLRQCFDKLLDIAKTVPPLVKTTLDLKSVLGF
jgi:hypothetical protein